MRKGGKKKKKKKKKTEISSKEFQEVQNSSRKGMERTY